MMSYKMVGYPDPGYKRKERIKSKEAAKRKWPGHKGLKKREEEPTDNKILADKLATLVNVKPDNVLHNL